jgi:hypothetical protein
MFIFIITPNYPGTLTSISILDTFWINPNHYLLNLSAKERLVKGYYSIKNTLKQSKIIDYEGS